MWNLQFNKAPPPPAPPPPPPPWCQWLSVSDCTPRGRLFDPGLVQSFGQDCEPRSRTEVPSPYYLVFEWVWRMDSPIIINWVSPLSFLGVLGVIFKFYSIFRWNFSKQTEYSPRWDAAFCGVTSGAILFAYVPSWKGLPGLNELSETLNVKSRINKLLFITIWC